MKDFRESVKKLYNYTKHLTKQERYAIFSIYIDFLKLNNNLGENL